MCVIEINDMLEKAGEMGYKYPMPLDKKKTLIWISVLFVLEYTYYNLYHNFPQNSIILASLRYNFIYPDFSKPHKNKI